MIKNIKFIFEKKNYLLTVKSCTQKNGFTIFRLHLIQQIIRRTFLFLFERWLNTASVSRPEFISVPVWTMIVCIGFHALRSELKNRMNEQKWTLRPSSFLFLSERLLCTASVSTPEFISVPVWTMIVCIGFYALRNKLKNRMSEQIWTLRPSSFLFPYERWCVPHRLLRPSSRSYSAVSPGYAVTAEELFRSKVKRASTRCGQPCLHWEN